ncbi:MAG TPA: sirohydrochlorin cobaltochelatase [Desulfobulbaceae bacterium]|nr:sirohydrochlorin cobaltochelatase [Desulfobulbaceae bacterium]
MEQKSAVILAMFGTTVEEALPGLLNIRAKMVEHCPVTPVRLAFTSKIIRRVWRERAADDDYRSALPQGPAELFAVRGPLATIAGLRHAGYTALVIQPVHIAPAEEYQDLRSSVEALAASTALHQGVRPLNLAVGRPALGTAGTGDAQGDELVAAAQALAADAELARTQQAALLYMGHGSKYFPAGPLYQRFAEAMRSLYPDVLTAIALVEGMPSVQDALRLLRQEGATRVVLKPLMVAAGDHARKDMVGPPPRGWQSFLSSEGFTVVPVLSGLGEHDPFAAIFVRHAAAAAAQAGIVLR